MKKTLSLSALMLMSAALTIAQSPLQRLKTTKNGKMLAHMHAPATASKTTAVNASRCIAEVYADASGGEYSPSDSVTFAYTGTWGSYGSTYAAYGSSPGLPVKFTTALEYLNGGGGYNLAAKVTNTFDANRNITVQLVQSWNSSTSTFDTIYQSVFTYDADNNTTTNILQIWDGTTSTWTNNTKDTLTYATGHLLTSDLNQMWDITSGTWQNYSLDALHYNTLSQQDTDTYQTWNTTTSAFENSNKEYDIYDASGNTIAGYDQYWDISSNAWVDFARINYSNFTGHNAQTSIVSQWDGTEYVKADSASYAYNSYGQLTDNRTETWDPSSSSWSISDGDGNLRLYYEEYTTAVKDVIQGGGSAQVYPVPASNNLSVLVNWDVPQAFTISLYNMQGMIVRQVQVPAMSKYKDDLQVNDFPAGNYVLKIDGTKGHLTEKFSVVR